MSQLIAIDNIFKIYSAGENSVYAINGISLEIEKGEFVAIVGQSGSGKSTLMNVLGCLDSPTRGSYFLGGKAVSDMKDNELSNIRNNQIGFIFQGFNLIPSLDALENVELPLIYRGIPKKVRRALAVESLIRVGLESRINHRPAEMSGGQQQRVAIARAIAARPSIILADEPTGNLDSKSGEDVIAILKQLNEEGKTIILITHDNKIAEMAERRIKIHDGKIVGDTSQAKSVDSAS